MLQLNIEQWASGHMREPFEGIAVGQQVAVRKSRSTLGGKPCYWIYAQPDKLFQIAEELGGKNMSKMVKVERWAENQQLIDQAAAWLMRRSMYDQVIKDKEKK